MNISLILTLITIIPFSFLFLIGFYNLSGNSVFGIFFSLAMLGAVIHVPLTIMVLSDALSIKFLKSNVIKFILIPIIIVFVFIYFAYINSQECMYMLMFFYIMWQSFHYGRQNIGILSVVKQHQKIGKITNFERLSLNCVAISGALGAPLLWNDGGFMLGPKLLSGAYLSTDSLMVVYKIAIVISSFAAFLAVIRSLVVYRKAPYVFLIYVAASAFFMPMLFIGGGLYVSFWPYAVTHGLQYCVMIFLYLYGSRVTLRNEYFIKGVALVIFSLVAIFYVAGPASSVDLVNFLIPFGEHKLSNESQKIFVGFIFGMTAAHFWIDQYIWRFSEAERREWFVRYFQKYISNNN